MKDADAEELSASRPEPSARHCINHALHYLFKDKTKRCSDLVVRCLTFEELIGTLLAAQDICEAHARLKQELGEYD